MTFLVFHVTLNFFQAEDLLTLPNGGRASMPKEILSERFPEDVD